MNNITIDYVYNSYYHFVIDWSEPSSQDIGKDNYYSNAFYQNVVKYDIQILDNSANDEFLWNSFVGTSNSYDTRVSNSYFMHGGLIDYKFVVTAKLFKTNCNPGTNHDLFNANSNLFSNSDFRTNSTATKDAAESFRGRVTFFKT